MLSGMDFSALEDSQLNQIWEEFTLKFSIKIMTWALVEETIKNENKRFEYFGPGSFSFLAVDFATFSPSETHSLLPNINIENIGVKKTVSLLGIRARCEY